MFIEILTNSNETLDQVQGFVVDTLVDFMPIVNIGIGGALPKLRNAAWDVVNNVYGQSRFQANDYIRIISLGVTLPLAFEFYNPEIWAFPYWSMNNGVTFKIEELTSIANFAGNPYLYYKLPFVNNELIIDVPINYPSFFGTNNISLCMDFPALLNKVSMVNVPAALNNKTFKIVPFMKIAHTLPMIIG